jgi:tetratricopeptide (TPR) repeat protein
MTTGVGYSNIYENIDDVLNRPDDHTYYRMLNPKNEFGVPTYYIKDFERAYILDTNSINIWVRVGLAKVYDKFSKPKHAKKFYEEAYAINSENADLLLAYSEFLIRNKIDYEWAENLLNKIPNIYVPDSVNTLREMLKDSVISVKDTSIGDKSQ